MLIAMKSKVAKWVLTALMLLVGGGLVISLGFGDLYRSVSRQAPAITIGDTRIYRAEVNDEFAKLVDQMGQAFGANIDPEQARAMGLMDSAVRNIVTKTLFEKYAADLGLTVSEEMVLARLASQPGLLDAEGRLDPLRLAEAMRSMGLTQEGLIAMIGEDIVRDQLYAPVATGTVAPAPVVDLIFGYRNERRTAETVAIAASAFPDPAEPDEATLVAYYAANGDRFMAPEYRSIDFVWFTPESFADTILLDEAQLREEYEARKAEFDQPERRKVEQILFADETSAVAAVERIKAGEEFAAVAQDMTGAAPIDMGYMEAIGVVSDLSILEETAFATAVGDIGGPVETPLGWHVVRVNEIQAAHTPTFEEVRDLLADEMRQGIAVDRMIETANLIDDQLAAGVNLKDAAATAGIDAVTVDAIDGNGLGIDGAPVVVDDPANFVGSLAFQTEPGETSLLTEDPDGNGYAVVQVNGANPSAIRPLDQVRADVIDSWRADERLRLAREKAEVIATAVNAGESLADLAAADGYSIVTSKPVTRSEGDSVANLPAALTGALFGLQPGAAVTGPVANGYVVAVLKEVQPADPAAETDRVDALRARTETDVATDLLNSMATALRDEYPVEVDQAVIDQEF